MSPEQRREAARNNIRGAAWMCGTVLCFVAMAVAGRQLSGRMDTAQIMLLRSLVGLVLIAPFAFVSGRVLTRRPFLHLTRNGVHFVGQFAWFYGIAALTLVDVTALNATTPVWATLMAMAFLGERAGFRRWAVIALGFAGVMVVLRPHAIPVSGAALVCLVGAAGYAGANVLSKTLMRTDTPVQVVFYMMLIQAPMSALILWDGWVAPVEGDVFWIGLVGAGGVLAHFTMNRAIQLAEISVAIPVTFVQLPLMSAVGFLLYLEVPDPWVLAGACMIFGGSWWNIRAERRLARPQVRP